MLRSLLSFLFSRPKPLKRCRRAPLTFDVLEDRDVPAQYLWTGTGAFENPANWTNLISPFDNSVPGAADDAIFNPDIGSNADCVLGADLNVERVVMDSDYTGTLTIASGSTLTVDDSFQQYGTLTLQSNGSGGTGIIADSFYINGAITMSAAGAASLVGGDFFHMGTITVTGISMFLPALTIDAAFSDAGTITVGSSGGGYGTLTIDGVYVQQSGETTTIWGNGLINYDGNVDQTIQGTINMTGDFSTDALLEVDGGEINTLGNGAAIAGHVDVNNGGVINVGSVSAASILTSLAGDLTISEGTLNLYKGSTLSIPAAAADSVFVVQGNVNMFGATISMAPSRVSYMLLDDGALYTEGAIMGGLAIPDTIVGNLTNNGTIGFGGGLHTLWVSVIVGGGAGGDYTQSTGVLEMRLNNSPANDVVLAGNNAILNGGTLSLDDVAALTAVKVWEVISAGTGVAGNFDSFNWPDAGTWGGAIDVEGTGYDVTKSANAP